MATKANPKLWESIKKKIIAESVAGTKSGDWSARKAQLAVKRYKDAGGDYIGKKSKSNSLVRWTKQDWKTKSGNPSSKTGERYLPSAIIDRLTDTQYKSTTIAKRRGTRKGKQYVSQPKKIRSTVRKLMKNL